MNDGIQKSPINQQLADRCTLTRHKLEKVEMWEAQEVEDRDQEVDKVAKEGELMSVTTATKKVIMLEIAGSEIKDLKLEELVKEVAVSFVMKKAIRKLIVLKEEVHLKEMIMIEEDLDLHFQDLI
ncbi:MAG: hypothetical protein ACKO96_39285 [Flammeovirgaceae bacterium]